MVDSVFTVLLSTTILVGGVLGCLLDNIIPGIVDRINNNNEVGPLIYLLKIKVMRKTVDWRLGRRKWN